MNPGALPLEDIIEPAAIGLFPLAWGWWASTAVAVAVVAALTWLFIRWRRHRAMLTLTLPLLDQAKNDYAENEDSTRYCQNLNKTLKRYLKACDENSQLSLSGEEWTAYLNRINPKATLSSKTINALAHGSYRREPDLAVELIDSELRRWLKRTTPKRVRKAISNTGRKAPYV